MFKLLAYVVAIVIVKYSKIRITKNHSSDNYSAAIYLSYVSETKLN